ncbi:hypothetical protein Bbelb_021140 [Branchiostoma belcheri]|nr:hypothetical protein Bbelb_021140 [Branchiostoma belcheri]
MATTAAKVLQATVMVAVTATIRTRRGRRCRLESDDGTGCSDVMVPKTSAITATAAAKFLRHRRWRCVSDDQDAKMAAMSPRSRYDSGSWSDDLKSGGKQWVPRLRQLWRQRYDCKAGEVTPVVGSSDDPGRDKGSDVA